VLTSPDKRNVLGQVLADDLASICLSTAQVEVVPEPLSATPRREVVVVRYEDSIVVVGIDGEIVITCCAQTCLSGAPAHMAHAADHWGDACVDVMIEDKAHAIKRRL
jgi:hypothetical protein